MATINHFGPYLSTNDNFQPGETAEYYFGEFPWSDKTVVVTAHPFANTDQSVSVTKVRLNELSSPQGVGTVYVTIRNEGNNILTGYSLWLTVIGP
jgi:hypothetical protein